MFLIDEYEFRKCVERYKGDRHAVKFNCRDLFIVMSFAQFTSRSGLRDIETTFNLCGAPPRLSEKSRRELKSLYPLYRGDNEFSILTGGTFTFKTVSPYSSNIKVMPKSTHAEVNEKWDWRIYQDFARTG